jgi:hypothetical protein
MTNPALLATAWAQAPPVTVPAAATVDLSAADSNDVEVSGTTGTITSFGVGVPWVRVRVKFQQTGVIVNTAGINRTMTAGDVLSMRADANGNWSVDDTVAQVGSGIFISFTASGTITIPSGARRAYVKMWGGSGCGGGSPDGYAGGPGSGAGGYLEKLLTGLTPGNTLIFTRGVGGNPTSPYDGTASILASGTQTIATLTANGSKYASTSAVGGTATGGDINLKGQSGGSATPNAPGTYNYYPPGIGGSTMLAHGVDGVTSGVSLNAGQAGGLLIAWGL